MGGGVGVMLACDCISLLVGLPLFDLETTLEDLRC